MNTNPNLIMTADEAYDLDNDVLFGNVLGPDVQQITHLDK